VFDRHSTLARASGGEAKLCLTPEENAKVMVDNFAKTFSQTETFDPTAVASCGRVG
jgi:hypothetical protein